MMARFSVIACLCLSLATNSVAEDALAKIVSTAEKAAAHADAGKVLAGAEKIAVQTAVAQVASGSAAATQASAAANTVAQPVPVEDAKTSKEKTTQAVLEAVTHAEGKAATDEDKKTTAVIEATMKVLRAEGVLDTNVAPQVIEKASQEAKDTFKRLDEANVGTKAAADAAAKVAVAEVDGASGKTVGNEVRNDAEKAAVAAGKGVADHPKDLSGALSEAVSTVKKEEETAGSVDITKADKGVVAGAVAKTEEAVKGLSAEADTVVEDHGVSVLAVPCMLAVGFLAYKILIEKDAAYINPYQKSLAAMREAEKTGSTESQNEKDTEFADYRPFP